jgi:hypothetical protein
MSSVNWFNSKYEVPIPFGAHHSVIPVNCAGTIDGTGFAPGPGEAVSMVLFGQTVDAQFKA